MDLSKYKWSYNVLKSATKIAQLRAVVGSDCVDEPHQKIAQDKLATAEATLMSHLSPHLGSIGKGLAVGTGLAVPLGVLGHHLENRAERKAEKFRNQTLAGGLAAGTGLLALQHGLHRGGDKHASADSIDDLCTDLATAVYIDGLIEKAGSADLGYNLDEIRALNNKRAADIILEVV